MAIDVHAHHGPPRLASELERSPGRDGVGVERGRDGAALFTIPAGP